MSQDYKHWGARNPPCGGTWDGVTQPQRKNPKIKGHLPVLGHGVQDEPHLEETPAWFISYAYLQVAPAQAGDIRKEHHAAGIKASTRGEQGGTLEAAEAAEISHTGCSQHRHARENPVQGQVLEAAEVPHASYRWYRCAGEELA